MPEDLVTRINSSDLLKVKNVFLFHVVPYSYTIDFYDSNKSLNSQLNYLL